MNTASDGRRTGARKLADDDRGAIMVVAVFMAAFLVGALWYVIGIGDAVLYRERMQDGADAVAYAGAVYHARGMNLIAMINVIMAGLLAVLVAMKLVQIINAIANVISCLISAACAVGAGCWAVPICTLTTNLESPISKAISAYEKFLKPTLKALSATQKGIAVAMPWVAEAKSVYIASKYYSKPVKTGGIVSASLIPMVPKERLGLPVQEDDYSFLCKKAGQYVGDVIFSPFGSFGGWVSGVIGGVAGTFPGYFCGAGGALGADFNKSAIDQLCAQKKKTFDDKYKHQAHRPKFDMAKCKKDAQKDMGKQIKQKVGGLGGLAGGMGADSMTSKRVFDDAQNGNGYFQVWSVVVGDDQWPRRADPGVKIAAWHKQMSMPPSPWGKVAFAEAEFYYDTSGKWEDYKEDAMWNMRWRARFRRVRPPTPDVATVIADVAGGKLANKLDDKVKDVLAHEDFMSWVLGTQTSGTVFDGFKAVVKGGGQWSDSKIQNQVLKRYDNLQVIH